jgi:hypothetical protein
MKKSIISILSTMVFFPLLSQTDEPKESGLTFGTDIVSRYIWRGINLGGPSPHVQPSIEYAAGNSGLTFGFWGSYGLGAGLALTEADFYIAYTPVDFLTFTLTDYFFPSDVPLSEDRYFNYREGETGHTIEGMVSFNGTGSFPLSLLFAINLYGADGTGVDGKNYYAKYLELGYTADYRGTGVGVFAGMALDNPDTERGAVGWYGDSGGLINLGITFARNIRIGQAISVPLFSSLIFNPEAGNIYIVTGLTF